MLDLIGYLNTTSLLNVTLSLGHPRADKASHLSIPYGGHNKSDDLKGICNGICQICQSGNDR